ncbi:MAG: competence protein ComEC family protein, partial [Gammaproteobacteria bacterium]|nr:competence protein ComEC family protein [Gammaproteobacteria bacterium]
MTIVQLAVAMLAGNASLFLLPALIPASGLLLLLLLALLLFLRSGKHPVAGFILVFIAAFGWAGFNAQQHLSAQASAMGGRIDTQILAKIDSIVRRSGTTLSFYAITRLHEYDLRIFLRWYNFDQSDIPGPGETWQLNVRMRRPAGSSNPAGNNYEDFAFRHQIVATGYVRRGANRLHEVSRIDGAVTRLRGQLSIALWQQFPNHPTMPLLAALAVGDRQFLSSEHWQVLRRTGLSHLVAISGLHVGIVAGLVYWLAALLCSRLANGLLATCLLAGLAASAYAALAGFTVPTQRALVVILVLLATRLTRRRLRPVHALSAALVFILISDPFSPLDPGFWLSFSAVLIIFFITAGRRQRGWRESVRIQLLIFPCMAPLVFFLFGQLSAVAPAANLLMVPLFTVLLVPLVLTGLVSWLFNKSIGYLVFGLAGTVLDSVWPLLEHLAALEILVYQGARPDLLSILLAALGVFWLMMPSGWPARWIGCLFLLPALVGKVAAPASDAFA